MFDIQRFAGGDQEERTGPMWFSCGAQGSNTLETSTSAMFLPSGVTTMVDYGGQYQNLIPHDDYEAGEYFSIKINGARLAFEEVQTSATEVELALSEGKTIADVTVDGDASNLTITIDGKDYTVSGGKLVEAAAEVVVQTTVINKTKRANGKIVSKSYPFINPAATSEQIATFINALNELTENTKEKIIRVDKTEIG